MVFPSSGFFGANMTSKFNATQLAINLVAATHKCALFTNSIVSPNLDTDTAYAVAPWNANEVTGTGYTAAGTLLVSPTFVESAGGITTWGASNPAWTSATFSAARGVLIHADALAPKAGIIAVTFGADFAVTSGTFTIAWASGNIATIDWIP